MRPTVHFAGLNMRTELKGKLRERLRELMQVSQEVQEASTGPIYALGKADELEEKAWALAQAICRDYDPPDED